MPSFSISKFTILPGPLRVSAFAFVNRSLIVPYPAAFLLAFLCQRTIGAVFYGFGGMGLKSGFPGSHPSFPRSMRGGGGMTASSSPA